MGIPLKQAIAVGKYIAAQKLRRRKRYPLVLMLEPLFRCNLECAGCGKIQHPERILDQHLSPEQCWAAAEECGAPMVSIAGGEPLIHPAIDRIAAGLVERGKFVYLCTNAILLERKLDLFQPDDRLTFNVHLDGVEARHDASVQRAGVHRAAVAAIRAAKARGFRVTTNSTIFVGHDPADLHRFFDEVTALGVDGMTISPGYGYERAPVQDKFLHREQTRALFREALAPAAARRWRFNHSPLYLDFLKGEREYQCTPWGSPNYSVLGWQRPCYLFGEGYARTFRELMEETDWDRYGTGRHEKCADCMVHCGYEPSAVEDSMASLGNVVRSIRSTVG
ncbi:adenosyl-hopene transferase HpnH [Anaeromyxobacter diazotrophicus]|uniref:Hopanoid biosynthesis associated radical SAM protein HpnH n=1 Tax=Anaeromyxobacter diazotrophicus TaxID=2590199 RepID=A0A7I9VQ85_9BACT|nr:adenosyl-hopene transferase HpnH [Anaeromyxobacter diazotrophicus]GEJ58137.1 hopanoid biosynthesis associated radical SAM protein HpnH [Anaeromyxobacter diazotrophicus]